MSQIIETYWLNRAAAMLQDEGRCSVGQPDATTTDRRWLWSLTGFLVVSGTTPGHRQMAYDLRQYLNETCVCHWHSYAAVDGIDAHRQCLYCHDVEWGELPSSHQPASGKAQEAQS